MRMIRFKPIFYSLIAIVFICFNFGINSNAKALDKAYKFLNHGKWYSVTSEKNPENYKGEEGHARSFYIKFGKKYEKTYKFNPVTQKYEYSGKRKYYAKMKNGVCTVKYDDPDSYYVSEGHNLICYMLIDGNYELAGAGSLEQISGTD